MSTPIVYGPDYSTYVRTVRMVFAEKPADYRLEPVDLLSGQGRQSAHLGRHPFGKVPAFEHDGFAFYETSAIARYVDQVFPGRRLQPADARQAARMNWAIGLLDSYGYGAIVGKIVWQRLITPMTGGTCDESIVEAARPTAATCLAELDRIKGSDPWLAGGDLTLADLWLAPIMAYFSMTPDFARMMEPCPGLRAWWDTMAQRPSLASTQPRLG
ncbi:glutathione S-transferase family protein [Alsobacter sp. SYSU M60028]|uniref:glutathione transferase n=1 Tax=Alsobacter ponti TaxID=2962936 RepID=A0ABT1LGA9_9HYPH|nr:glutathione S-transferase family protein [Alsobacter ponti]MCP8939288.1 glutathione S-transferase family protein [Alsobacter ponti]